MSDAVLIQSAEMFSSLLRGTVVYDRSSWDVERWAPQIQTYLSFISTDSLDLYGSSFNNRVTYGTSHRNRPHSSQIYTVDGVPEGLAWSQPSTDFKRERSSGCFTVSNISYRFSMKDCLPRRRKMSLHDGRVTWLQTVNFSLFLISSQVPSLPSFR